MTEEMRQVILGRLKAGMSPKTLAPIYGVPVSTITFLRDAAASMKDCSLHAVKLPSKKPSPKTKPIVIPPPKANPWRVEAWKFRQSGLTFEQIAKKLGRNVATVFYAIKKLEKTVK